jgi:hypothetical protein
MENEVLNRTKVLESIVNSHRTGEKNDLTNTMLSLIQGKSDKIIAFEKLDDGDLTIEEKKIINQKYDEYLIENNVKECRDNEDFSAFEKIRTAISSFLIDNNPFPFMNLMDDTIDDLFDKLKYSYFIPEFIFSIKNDIETLKENPIILNKKRIFEKWDGRFNEINGLYKHKHADYLENIGLFITAYNNVSNRINPKMCFYTADLIIKKLLDDFNVIDFIQTYYKAIEKYDTYYSEHWRLYSKEEIDIMFAEEFKNQYIMKIIPSIKLV